MDGVIRGINAILLGRGLSLFNEDGREWNVDQLLFADDTTLVADSQKRLRQLVKKNCMVCERRKLRVNVGWSKVYQNGG